MNNVFINNSNFFSDNHKSISSKIFLNKKYMNYYTNLNYIYFYSYLYNVIYLKFNLGI